MRSRGPTSAWRLADFCVHSPGALACITPNQAGPDPPAFFCLCMQRMHMCQRNAASSPGQTCPGQAPEHPRPRQNDSWCPPLTPQVRGHSMWEATVIQSCAHQHKAATMSHRRHILHLRSSSRLDAASLAVSIRHFHAGTLLCNCCCKAFSFHTDRETAGQVSQTCVL